MGRFLPTPAGTVTTRVVPVADWIGAIWPPIITESSDFVVEKLAPAIVAAPPPSTGPCTGVMLVRLGK